MIAVPGVVAGTVPPTIAPKTLEAIRSIMPASIPASIPVWFIPGTIPLDAFVAASTVSGPPPRDKPSLLVVMVVAHLDPFEHAERIFGQDRR